MPSPRVSLPFKGEGLGVRAYYTTAARIAIAHGLGELETNG
jgi:hypothetical protein